jgi:branched-chain amino acid transport system substrate-binding protein
MPRRSRTVIGLLLAGALLAGACSSSSKSSSSTPTSTPATSGGTSAAGSGSGSPIVIGGVASIEGAGAAGIDTGFQARIARFNKAGGLNGRMIKFVGVQDDGGPSGSAKALSIVQSLVEQQHVFAVAPITSLAFNGSQLAFLAQNHVPMIGWGITPDWCGSPWAFPLTGCLDGPLAHQSNLTEFPLYLSHVGKTPSQVRLAVFGSQDPASETSVANQTKIFKQLGYDVVYSAANVVDNSTDYTPYAQPIVASNPTLVYSLTNFSNSVGIFAAIRAEGYKGDILNNTGEIPGIFTTQPAVAKTLDGGYSTSEFPVGEEQTPVIMQIQADLAAIGQPTSISLGDSVGWWSADLLISGLQATAAKGPVTPQSFDQVLNANFTYNSPEAGGIEGLSFPQHNVQAGTLGCADLIQVNDAAKVWEVPGKYTCQAPYNVPK